jgi:hypothetical protein
MPAAEVAPRELQALARGPRHAPLRRAARPRRRAWGPRVRGRSGGRR